ncbi:hypothetical protein J5N97_007281 [Dioscorea zingiberensis]|uniref:Uncharacterized protein n=1 Tax=Dioscorea zingiberensis TaxID=325984 RepID=A0A9D5DBZ7_9LILI|nr:hypothetical protein J5N97_007281 [Dioscorea zingiberensis]
MARPGVLALAIVLMAGFTVSVSATARRLTTSNPSSSFPLLAVKNDSQPNPLLLQWEIPPYDLLRPEHLVPGTKQIIAELESELSQLEANVPSDYVALVRPLEKIYDRIQVYAYLMANYMRLKMIDFGDPAGEAADLLDAFEARMWTSHPIHNAFKAIQASSSWSTLTESQQSVVKLAMSEAKQNGVDLSAADKQKVKDIQSQIETLGGQYTDNADADPNRLMDLIQKQPVSILPSTVTEMIGNMSSITNFVSENILSHMCFSPDKTTADYSIMRHACDRSLRQKLYIASLQTASSGSTNNGAVIEQMLTLRWQLAKLLGYNSYAELALGEKLGMVENVLQKLRDAAKTLADQDLNDLKNFVQSKDSTAANDLQRWDISYWKWIKNAGDPNYVDETAMSEYFTLESVLEVLFKTINKLFAVTIEPADGQAPVWHKDVKFFCVKDGSGKPLGYFYLDAYARDEKYTGFWTSEITVRSQTLARPGQSVRLPVYLIGTQFTSPPTLMGFYEVEIASVDLELHSKWTPGGSESIYDIYNRIVSEVEALPPIPEDKTICTSMRQEFSGDYASVFFDYLLSDVLAADAFTALEAVGLTNAKIFKDFRGREPTFNVETMLQLKGMADATKSWS